MSSKNYFDGVAQQWDAMRSGFFSEAIRDRALQWANVLPGGVAADLGAGTGFMTEALMQRGVEVIAVDQSEAMLAQITAKLGRSRRLQIRQGVAEALPVADGSVDYVFANMYLHHVEDPSVAIREAARVLRPGGKLIITDLDKHEFDFLRTEQHDRWLGFERADVSRWMQQAGLNDVTVRAAEQCCCSKSDCGSQAARITVFLAGGVKPAAVEE